MFEVSGRAALQERLVRAAQRHPDVLAAALLGSAARGDQDRFSDIDLALRLAPGTDLRVAAREWTDVVARTETVVDHLDVDASGAVYRVLLLSSTLQVDLSFWPSDQPLREGSPVKVLFGEMPVGRDDPTARDPASDSAVGMAWLYALHARSALGRGRPWQARWMLDALRDVVVGLYCRRFGLPGAEGRGVDRLPATLLAGLEQSRPTTTDPVALRQAFVRTTALLITELHDHGPAVSPDLLGVLARLTEPGRSSSAS